MDVGCWMHIADLPFDNTDMPEVYAGVLFSFSEFNFGNLLE